MPGEPQATFCRRFEEKAAQQIASDRDPVVGDIYLCPDVARANARERGVPVRDELARLVVHGVLHVLGHDHPIDDGREMSDMWLRQERVVQRLIRRQARGRR